MSAQSTTRARCLSNSDNLNQHNALAPPASLATRITVVSAATLLVISSAGMGCVYAWQQGEHHGPALAVLAVAMALGLELAKPFAVEGIFASLRRLAIGQAFAMLALAALAISYSLSAELSLLAQTRGDAVAQRAAAARAAETVDHQRARIEAELKALGVVRPAAQINADLAGLLAAHRIDACEPWLPVKQRTVCAEQVQPLRAELGKAERRERLERDLAALSTGPQSAVVAPDAGAKALSTYLGALGVHVPAAVLSEFLVLIAVLALEIGSALAVLLVRSVQPATVRTKALQPASYDTAISECPDSEKPTTTGSGLSGQLQLPAPVQTAAEQSKRRRGSRLGTMARTERTAAETAIVDAVASAGGRMPAASVRTLAERIAASRSTTHAALLSLIAAGTILQANGELILRT